MILSIYFLVDMTSDFFVCLFSFPPSPQKEMNLSINMKVNINILKVL